MKDSALASLSPKEGQEKEDVKSFTFEWWKPTPENRIRELQKEGALIAAEIDRLQRLNNSTSN